jgi:hypothetical protein
VPCSDYRVMAFCAAMCYGFMEYFDTVFSLSAYVSFELVSSIFMSSVVTADLKQCNCHL